MSSTGLHNLDSAVQKFNVWLKDLDQLYGWENRQKTYKALSVTLHAIRDHLTVEQTAHFSAQLPLILRGVYYDGFVPSRVPVKERRLEQFFERITDNFDQAPGGNLVNPEWIVTSVFELLNNHISAGEIQDVRNELPGAVRKLWPVPGNGAAQPGAPSR